MVDHGVGLVSRVLPPEEWPRLRETGACAVRATDAERGSVLVEELGSQIVGVAVVFQTPDRHAHIDGVWVHPAFRTGRVALRLWRRIRRVLGTLGARRASVYPTTPRLHAWAIRAPRLRVKGLFTTEVACAR
jgi:hypothetical protein